MEDIDDLEDELFKQQGIHENIKQKILMTEDLAPDETI